jgi:hypothetical protein
VVKARREDAVADRPAGGVASLQSCPPDESRAAFRIVAVAVTVEAEVSVAKTAEVSVLLAALLRAELLYQLRPGWLVLVEEAERRWCIN